jgi:glycosyltransferase involved in cell wall biosynthesis
MGEVVDDGVTGFVFAGDDREAVGEATLRALGQSSEELAAMSARVAAHVANAFTLGRELDALLALLA